MNNMIKKLFLLIVLFPLGVSNCQLPEALENLTTALDSLQTSLASYGKSTILPPPPLTIKSPITDKPTKKPDKPIQQPTEVKKPSKPAQQEPTFHRKFEDNASLYVHLREIDSLKAWFANDVQQFLPLERIFLTKVSFERFEDHMKTFNQNQMELAGASASLELRIEAPQLIPAAQANLLNLQVKVSLTNGVRGEDMRQDISAKNLEVVLNKAEVEKYEIIIAQVSAEAKLKDAYLLFAPNLQVDQIIVQLPEGSEAIWSRQVIEVTRHPVQQFIRIK